MSSRSQFGLGLAVAVLAALLAGFVYVFPVYPDTGSHYDPSVTDTYVH